MTETTPDLDAFLTPLRGKPWLRPTMPGDPEPRMIAVTHEEYNWLKEQAGRYRLVARAMCRAQGIDPDDVISDAGHLAWELVGHNAAREEKALG